MTAFGPRMLRSLGPWATALMVTLAQPGAADSPDSPPPATDAVITADAPAIAAVLQPFTVNYRVNVSKIPTPIRATLTLTEAGDDQYRMGLAVKSMLMDNSEQSLFQWRNCQPHTLTYQHDFEGFRRERHHRMTFNWDTLRVSGHSSADDEGQDDFDYSITEDTLDELTMLLKARCIMQEGVSQYQLTSAYGKRLRTHFIHVVGEETMNTPLGRLRTIKFEKRRDQDSKRRTIFWLAPDLDYLLVRARHVEGTGLFGELKMTGYDGPYNALKK